VFVAICLRASSSVYILPYGLPTCFHDYYDSARAQKAFLVSTCGAPRAVLATSDSCSRNLGLLMYGTRGTELHCDDCPGLSLQECVLDFHFIPHSALRQYADFRVA